MMKLRELLFSFEFNKLRDRFFFFNSQYRQCFIASKFYALDPPGMDDAWAIGCLL